MQPSQVDRQKTWNSFVRTLRKGGYHDLLTLSERLETKAEAQRETMFGWRKKLEDVKAAHLRVEALAKQHGLRSEVRAARSALSESEEEGVEWFRAAGDNMLYVFAPSQSKSFPLLRIPESWTWKQALAHSMTSVNKAADRADEACDALASLDDRLSILVEVISEYENNGEVTAISSPSDKEKSASSSLTRENHFDRRAPYAPYTGWIVSTYHQVREEVSSDSAAREEVQQQFEKMFGAELREKYGDEMSVSESTIRRMLDEK